jgi:H+/gluconate symporter-like permease
VDLLIILLPLLFLMFAAYRGFSVILFAPVAAMAAVFLTGPHLVLPFFSGVFMERMVAFVKLYFPVFLLGAIFGKVVELSGFARSIINAMARVAGPSHAITAIAGVCAVLTYGGVSLFVVAFAVYPFAAELFRAAGIPKRLIPGTIALGAFTFTMDALPGSPQIQNIIPTTFFHTDAWAAPRLGLIGGVFVLVIGLAYLQWRRRQAERAGEGYGEERPAEPERQDNTKLPHPLLALLPLVMVGVLNKLFSIWIPAAYGSSFSLAAAGFPGADTVDVSKLSALWAVEAALLAAILTVIVCAFGRLRSRFSEAGNSAVGGAMLAALNTGSEYGFGAVIAMLPGFRAVNEFLTHTIRDPLLNAAVTTTTLAGITGSASGGMSIVLGSMGAAYLERAQAAGISPDALHRVTAMASGGMDTLPHNGAIITLLAVTGLTHRQSYRDIFAMTVIKTAAVFVVIAVYHLTGIV